MIVTVTFENTSGPKQFLEIKFRIETVSFSQAVVETIDQAVKITTVKIVKVVVEA